MKIHKPGFVASPTVIFDCRSCGARFETVKNIEAKLVFDQREGNYWEHLCPTTDCNKMCTKQET